MGWYVAPGDFNGVACSVCGGPIKGRDISNEEFNSPHYKEERDKIYFEDFATRKASHAICMWREAEKNK